MARGGLARIEGRCNATAARRAARYLSAAYDRALAPVGLRSTQFTLLYKLATAGPLTIKRLAEAIAMDRTTLAANLKPLEREGLLATATAQDRRARVVELTPEGRVRLEAAVPFWQEVQSRFETSFGVEAAGSLRQSLRKVLETGLEPWAEGTIEK
jgi:DNA-binding MarR family transcriptional regulator